MNALSYLIIGVLAAANIVALLTAMRFRVLSKTGRAAAQEMCQLVGDAQRMLNRVRALWLYFPVDAGEQVLSSALKQNTEDWSALSNPMKNPEREAGKITHWSEKADEKIALYSDFIGQQPKDDAVRIDTKVRMPTR